MKSQRLRELVYQAEIEKFKTSAAQNDASLADQPREARHHFGADRRAAGRHRR